MPAPEAVGCNGKTRTAHGALEPSVVWVCVVVLQLLCTPVRGWCGERWLSHVGPAGFGASDGWLWRPFPFCVSVSLRVLHATAPPSLPMKRAHASATLFICLYVCSCCLTQQLRQVSTATSIQLVLALVQEWAVFVL